MDSNTFSKLVTQHFGRLLDEYGFAKVAEQYDAEHFGNALVDYHSPTVGVRIVLDRGQVLVDIGPLEVPPQTWPDMFNVLEFLVPEVRGLEYILPETSTYEALERQIVRLAHLLHSYGEPALRGRFIQWQQIRDANRRRAKEEYEKLTGRPYPNNIYSSQIQDVEEERARITPRSDGP